GFRAELPQPRPFYPTVHIGVDLAADALDERIGHRVDRMWSEGLVAEVRALEARGLRDGRTASRALGYHQALSYLDGEVADNEARADTVRATRRLVRRQRSWFRRDPRITWLDGADRDLVPAALDHARAALDLARGEG